jgi:hypothetical protein
MSVMDKYVPITHMQGERASVPIPASSGLGQLPSLELFEEIASTLGLTAIGVYTAWATRTGDMTWEPEEQQPSTNLMVWSLTDHDVNLAQQIAFGNPVPFVAVMTDVPLTSMQIDAMWEDTAYAAYETQAVYRQDDAKPVPTIRFLHWGERIDMSNAPQHIKPLESAARSVNGQLILASQISGTTSQRDFPAMPFADALAAQLALSAAAPVPGASPVVVGPTPQQLPIAPVPTQQSNVVAPVLVGLAVGGLVFWWARRKEEK